MNYKSYCDLAADVLTAAHKIPGDIDLIVGVPRSGLLAASVLGLNLNRRICDLQSFLNNGLVANGKTRSPTGFSFDRVHDARSVLIVDDSIATGSSLDQVRAEVAGCEYKGKVLYMAVYATDEFKDDLDCFAEVVPLPRIFQWNLFHRVEAEYYCVDIDGVLCFDPSKQQNDDSKSYRDFLLNATPLARPTYPIGHLVTSRLEKYRAETEAWLHQRSIKYGHLHMLDLKSAEERRRQRIHASFKADIYSKLLSTVLFVESEANQAHEICMRSGKPVLDYGNQKLVHPGFGLSLIMQKNRKMSARITNKIRHIARQLF